MKICPYCEQDAVWVVRLKSRPDTHFMMCFECDAVWLENQLVSAQAGTTFDKYVRTQGLEPDWSGIEKIEVVE
jgi:Zn-finger nucleic acid-binding protein